MAYLHDESLLPYFNQPGEDFESQFFLENRNDSLGIFETRSGRKSSVAAQDFSANRLNVNPAFSAIPQEAQMSEYQARKSTPPRFTAQDKTWLPSQSDKVPFNLPSHRYQRPQSWYANYQAGGQGDFEEDDRPSGAAAFTFPVGKPIPLIADARNGGSAFDPNIIQPPMRRAPQTSQIHGIPSYLQNGSRAMHPQVIIDQESSFSVHDHGKHDDQKVLEARNGNSRQNATSRSPVDKDGKYHEPNHRNFSPSHVVPPTFDHSQGPGQSGTNPAYHNPSHDPEVPRTFKGTINSRQDLLDTKKSRLEAKLAELRALEENQDQQLDTYGPSEPETRILVKRLFFAIQNLVGADDAPAEGAATDKVPLGFSRISTGYFSSEWIEERCWDVILKCIEGQCLNAATNYHSRTPGEKKVKFEDYDSWEERVEMVIMLCSRNKLLCMSLLGGDWVERLADAPYAEWRAKLSNGVVNSVRNLQNKAGRDKLRGDLSAQASQANEDPEKSVQKLYTETRNKRKVQDDQDLPKPKKTRRATKVEDQPKPHATKPRTRNARSRPQKLASAGTLSSSAGLSPFPEQEADNRNGALLSGFTAQQQFSNDHNNIIESGNTAGASHAATQFPRSAYEVGNSISQSFDVRVAQGASLLSFNNPSGQANHAVPRPQPDQVSIHPAEYRMAIQHGNSPKPSRS